MSSHAGEGQRSSLGSLYNKRPVPSLPSHLPETADAVTLGTRFHCMNWGRGRGTHTFSLWHCVCFLLYECLFQRERVAITFLSVPWTEQLGRDGTVVHLSLSPAFSTFSPHYKEQRDKELRGGRTDLLGVWEPESCGLIHGGADPGRHTRSLRRHRVSHGGICWA